MHVVRQQDLDEVDVRAGEKTVDVVLDRDVPRPPGGDLGLGLRDVAVADADEAGRRVLQIFDRMQIGYAPGADDADTDR